MEMFPSMPQRFSTTLPDKNTSQHNRGDEDTDSESDDLSGLGDTAGPPHMIFYTPQPSSTVVEIDEARQVLLLSLLPFAAQDSVLVTNYMT